MGLKSGLYGGRNKTQAPLALMAFSAGFALVGRQIIHNDDIAFFEGWGELFLDVGLEDAPVHGGIDDEGGGEPVAAQAGDEGLGHPMPERRL